MSMFLRSLLSQDWCYFICLACTKAKYFIVLDGYAAANLELFHDTPDFAKDFDFCICLACTMANAPIFTTVRSLFPTNMMVLKECSCEDNGRACLLVPFIGFFLIGFFFCH